VSNIHWVDVFMENLFYAEGFDRCGSVVLLGHWNVKSGLQQKGELNNLWNLSPPFRRQRQN
jgi:hypothetical protein